MFPFSHFTATKFSEYDCHTHKILMPKCNSVKLNWKAWQKLILSLEFSKFIQGFYINP